MASDNLRIYDHRFRLDELEACLKATSPAAARWLAGDRGQTEPPLQVTQKPSIYIAGPMSKHFDYNRPAFNSMADYLRGLGYHVINPAEALPRNSWGEYVRIGLMQMMRQDRVVLLPGWQQSPGASLEYEVARSLNMPIYHISYGNDGWVFTPESSALPPFDV